jgi:hypothetical protein
VKIDADEGENLVSKEDTHTQDKHHVRGQLLLLFETHLAIEQYSRASLCVANEFHGIQLSLAVRPRIKMENTLIFFRQDANLERI